jgi:hypothetical protein
MTDSSGIIIRGMLLGIFRIRRVLTMSRATMKKIGEYGVSKNS